MGSKFKQALSSFFEMPQSAFGKSSAVTSEYCGETSVTECAGLISYDDSAIVLKLCDCRAAIYGRGLTMSFFGNGELTISGKVERIDFTDL